MAESLKLSIITPSYNHGRFLEQTILSVINQDYTNVEHIIIDGVSTDDSVEIIRKYEKHIAYWMSEPDEGHRYALQKGFARATGEVVAWQNADDYYEPNVFAQVMRVFQERPDVDLVYGNVRLVDENSEQVGELRFVPTNYWSMLFEGFTMHNQAAFFRRRLWDEMGGITFQDYFFDYDLFVRATRLAHPFFIHQTLGNYRAHAGSGHFGGQLESKRNAPWVTSRRYMGKWGRLPTVVFKTIALVSLARRTLLHMWLGDWDYLRGGFRRRILRFRSE